MLILKHRQRKQFIERMSFSAVPAPEMERAALHHAGISMGLPQTTTKESFDKMMSGLSLGLFGGSGDPDKFYPAITSLDVMPKPEDFVDIPFRFITETIVGGGSWKASDFAANRPLEASTEMLANKPMFTEHDQQVNNWAGLVIDPYWDKESLQDGQKVPPGISGIARVDFKTNPKLARGLLFGAIYSTSVTVDFGWEPSHTFKDLYEFYDKIGSFGDDKQMIRRVVTEVRDYHESSFVWLGADPFAKRKTSAGLTNIDKNSVYFSKPDTMSYSKLDETHKEKYTEEKTFDVECGIPETIISLSQEKTKTTRVPNPKNEIKMNKFLLAFISTFGANAGLTFKAEDITGDKLTSEQELELTAAIGKLGLSDPATTTKLATFTKLETMALEAAKAKDATVASVDLASFIGTHSFVEVTSLAEMRIAKTTVEELATELKVEAPKLRETVKSLGERAAAGDAFTKFKRDEAIRLYKLAKGDAADESMIGLINKSVGTELDALLKANGGEANMQYGAHCTECNSSEHIEMRSSVNTGDDENNSPTTVNKVGLSTDDIRERYSNQNTFIGRNG